MTQSKSPPRSKARQLGALFVFAAIRYEAGFEPKRAAGLEERYRFRIEPMPRSAFLRKAIRDFDRQTCIVDAQMREGIGNVSPPNRPQIVAVLRRCPRPGPELRSRARNGLGDFRRIPRMERFAIVFKVRSPRGRAVGIGTDQGVVEIKKKSGRSIHSPAPVLLRRGLGDPACPPLQDPVHDGGDCTLPPTFPAQPEGFESHDHALFDMDRPVQ